MANRVLAYISSVFLISLSLLSWIAGGSGQVSEGTAARVGEAFGWFWLHFGLPASGLSVIVILAFRVRDSWARLFAAIHNAVTLLVGICVFGVPAWLPESAMSALAPFYTVLGCLLILAGLMNVGALLQRPVRLPPSPAPEQAPTIETHRQHHTDFVKGFHQAGSRQRALPRRAIWTGLGFFMLAGGISASIWLHGGPRIAAGNSTGPIIHLTADQVFASASPSVVKVLVRDANFQVICQGSGFYVTDDGRIVTNYHVIQDASSATIIETNGTIREVDFVLATDADADLAILKVSRRDGPKLKLASTLPRIGAKAYALGNPQGFTDTLSEGIVSGLRNETSVPAIQTTAAISPGSSGGPLIGDDGAAMGVTAATWTIGQALNPTTLLPLNPRQIG